MVQRRVSEMARAGAPAAMEAEGVSPYQSTPAGAFYLIYCIPLRESAMYSRRDFGRIALAGVPLTMAMGAKINSTVNGVRLGTITYSFRDFPRTPGADNLDAIIQALTTCGIGEIELFAPNAEPASANAGRRGPAPTAGAPPEKKGGRRGPPSAEQQAAMRKNREDLRQWRLTTPVDHFKAIRKKFDDAGIRLYAYTMNYSADFTGEEIDKTFEQAKGLGVSVIASSTQISMAPRLLPAAEKHKIYLAFHGHDNDGNPDEFSTPATFQKVLDMSKWARVNLDIGHFTAANGDAVAYIQEHHERITHLHVKDRKKNHGANLPFGEGDTPIKETLLLLKAKKYPIPAFVEYEYRGTGTSVEEVTKCMDYMKKALM